MKVTSSTVLRSSFAAADEICLGAYVSAQDRIGCRLRQRRELSWRRSLAQRAARWSPDGLSPGWRFAGMVRIRCRWLGRAHEFGNGNFRRPFHVTDNRQRKCEQDDKLNYHGSAYSPPLDLIIEQGHRAPPETGHASALDQHTISRCELPHVSRAVDVATSFSFGPIAP